MKDRKPQDKIKLLLNIQKFTPEERTALIEMGFSLTSDNEAVYLLNHIAQVTVRKNMDEEDHRYSLSQYLTKEAHDFYYHVNFFTPGPEDMPNDYVGSSLAQVLRILKHDIYSLK